MTRTRRWHLGARVLLTSSPVSAAPCTAGAASLAFVDNATTALNAVLRSLEFGPGDEILLNSQSYGALRQIARRLRKAYGAPPAPRRLPPLDELVLTILSQNTNDTNRDRAYADGGSRPAKPFAGSDAVYAVPLHGQEPEHCRRR